MKTNKILVVTSRSAKEREIQLSKWLIQYGFAMIMSDAKKLIQYDIPVWELDNRYFVVIRDANLHQDVALLPKLAELVHRGVFVAIGTHHVIPAAFSWCSEVINLNN